jgi:uncharacterized protein DUF4416
MTNLLFFALMYSNDIILNKTKLDLIKQYKTIKSESNFYEFNFTRYYEKEMGGNLKKKFIVFNKDILKKDLIEVKLFITKLEEKYMINNNRTINIDPGFLSKKELVLATFKAKNFKEKLNDKVFSHKVLEFDNDKIIEFFHTFADYKEKYNQDFILNNRPHS